METRRRIAILVGALTLIGNRASAAQPDLADLVVTDASACLQASPIFSQWNIAHYHVRIANIGGPAGQTDTRIRFTIPGSTDVVDQRAESPFGGGATREFYSELTVGPYNSGEGSVEVNVNRRIGETDIYNNKLRFMIGKCGEIFLPATFRRFIQDTRSIPR